MPRPRWADHVREALYVGVCAGIAYFAVDLIRLFPREEMSLIGSNLLKANLFAYSLSVWICGFTALCIIIELLLLPLSLRWPGPAGLRLRRFILLLVVIVVFAAGHAVWSKYVGAPPFQQRQIVLRDLGVVLLGVILGSALAALAGSLAASTRAVERSFAGRLSTRPMLAIVFCCLAYIAVANLASVAARRWVGEAGEPALENRRIVMLGVDCGSWNVMLPYLDSGDLPGFKRMMMEGSYGYLGTYAMVGAELTPPSWTTIATGKTVEKHGIAGFGQLSSEWRAAPIWSILSRAGRTVAVVDWVCTWPPFKVNGMFISNESPSRIERTYFSSGLDSLAARADSLIAESYRHTSGDGAAAGQAEEPGTGFLSRAQLTAFAEAEIEFLKAIERDVVSRQAPDFISYYCYTTDALQHRFSENIDRASSEGGSRDQEPADSAGGDIVRWAWMSADTFLTDLMARYGEDAYYLVVSDHGARQVMSRTAVFEMDTLLREMGYLRTTGGEVDSAASVCFPSAARSAYSKFHVKVNRGALAVGGALEAGSLEEVVSRIAAELKSVRIKETGRHIFDRVDALGLPRSADQPDIVVFAGKSILAMPEKDMTVIAGAKEIPLRSLVIAHPWTAQHRARGIILAKGPGVRRHYTGSWTLADPYASIYPYVLGAAPAVGWAGRVLRGLHVFDPATTLDVAPTLLYLAGLPVAEDMDGRVLTEVIDAGLLGARPIEKVATFAAGSIVDVKTDAVDRDKVKKTLKALGYLQ